MATEMAIPSTANHPPNPPKSHKRLIVCCDGTWETSDHATKDDSSYETNITRMCHAIAENVDGPDGTTIPQVKYYQSGVGTTAPTALGGWIEGIFGVGLDQNILSAYNFLVNNYNPGDEIFLFGFSRGSFTCRSLAGMISKFGILKRQEAAQWFAGIWDRYRENHKWAKHKHKPAYYPVKIKVIGCWDTVGALGVPDNFWTKLLGLNRKYAFHNTEISDKVENAFHALALDERRLTFRPTLWYMPPEQADIPRTRLKQCWFAGVHTDVGRGYPDQVPGDIADITFAWMVDKCHGLLAFHEDEIPGMLGKGDFEAPEGDWAKRERNTRVAKAKTWGLADLHDSMFWIFKWLPVHRTPGQYVFTARESSRLKRYKNGTSGSPSGSGFVTKSKILSHEKVSAWHAWHAWLWSTRSGVLDWLPEDTSKFDPVCTSEVIHPSVRIRMMKDPTYRPPALRDFKLHHDAADSCWIWTKTWTDDNGAVREKILKEESIEDWHFSMHHVGPEMLKFRADEKEPIPPKPKSRWRFWTW